MLSLYGFDACEQLEGLARELEVPRLRMYTHKQFMKELTLAEKDHKTDIDTAAEAIANIVPSIFQEQTQKLKAKLKGLEKTYSSYKQAYEAIDKFNSQSRT